MTIENAIHPLRWGGDLSEKAIMLLARHDDPLTPNAQAQARKQLFENLAVLVSGETSTLHDTEYGFLDAARVVVGVSRAFGDEDRATWLSIALARRSDVLRKAFATFPFVIPSFSASYGAVLGLFHVAIDGDGQGRHSPALERDIAQLVGDLRLFSILDTQKRRTNQLRIDEEKERDAYKAALRDAIQKYVQGASFSTYSVERTSPTASVIARRLSVMGMFHQLLGCAEPGKDPLIDVIATKLTMSLMSSLDTATKIKIMGEWSNTQLAAQQ